MQTFKNPEKSVRWCHLLSLVIIISCNKVPESGSALVAEMKDSLIPVESVPNLYQWTDVCNAYVFRDGDKALLIDLGNGSVLSHLADIGVSQVEWILFTHHHREQCQGYPLLKDPDTQIAAPAAERILFERPSDFAKVKPSLDDPWSVYGASYIRPPVQPIPVDRAFALMDTFTWHGYTFWCMETPATVPAACHTF